MTVPPRDKNARKSENARPEDDLGDAEVARTPDRVVQSVCNLSALKILLSELNSRMTTDGERD